MKIYNFINWLFEKTFYYHFQTSITFVESKNINVFSDFVYAV